MELTTDKKQTRQELFESTVLVEYIFRAISNVKHDIFDAALLFTAQSLNLNN